MNRRRFIFQQFLCNFVTPNYHPSEIPVDAIAEVWKMLVAAIEMSDGFIGVVSMILLMLLATRTRREASKNDLKNGWWLLHKPSKTQNLPPNFRQFLIFCNLEIYKISLHTQLLCSQPLAFNQPTTKLVDALGPLEDQL